MNKFAPLVILVLICWMIQLIGHGLTKDMHSDPLPEQRQFMENLGGE